MLQTRLPGVSPLRHGTSAWSGPSQLGTSRPWRWRVMGACPTRTFTRDHSSRWSRKRCRGPFKTIFVPDLYGALTCLPLDRRRTPTDETMALCQKELLRSVHCPSQVGTSLSLAELRESLPAQDPNLQLSCNADTARTWVAARCSKAFEPCCRKSTPPGSRPMRPTARRRFSRPSGWKTPRAYAWRLRVSPPCIHSMTCSRDQCATGIAHLQTRTWCEVLVKWEERKSD
jgi:hypothetical protein